MKIHKKGFNAILVSGIILLTFNAIIFVLFGKCKLILISTGIISFLLWIFIIRFFRIPKRTVTQCDNCITAPADGKVVVIEKTTENEYLKTKMLQVSIFMSVWNVHQNLSPVNGKVTYYKYHPGLFLLARNPKSSDDNERTSIVFETADKTQIMIRQIAGYVARRIICLADKKKEFKQNEEIGFIKFGSRVDILLPEDSKILVKIGDKTKGGITKIAELNHG